MDEEEAWGLTRSSYVPLDCFAGQEVLEASLG